MCGPAGSRVVGSRRRLGSRGGLGSKGRLSGCLPPPSWIGGEPDRQRQLSGQLRCSWRRRRQPCLHAER